MANKEFSKAQLSQIRNYIQEAFREISSCYNCQPSGRDAEDIWIGGDRTSLYDFLLYSVEVPEDFLDEVTKWLHCPGCGTDLDLECEIGTLMEMDKKAISLWDEWDEKYGEQYKQFHQYLEQFPMLGLQNQLGGELFREVANFPKITIENRIGFRARRGDAEVKTSDDMMPPPIEVGISEGRYNHFGQRVFYIANSENGAANEVLEAEGVVWMQKFKIIKVNNILDVTLGSFEELYSSYPLLSFGILFAELLNDRVERKQGWKPEYFIPRFIADCVKFYGFTGIKYKSTRWLEDNLVLFDWTDDEVVPDKSPYRYTLEKQYVSLVGSKYMSEFFAYGPISEDELETRLKEFNKVHRINA
jgi:hypothetical protein